jgi:hypothetical protein
MAMVGSRNATSLALLGSGITKRNFSMSLKAARRQTMMSAFVATNIALNRSLFAQRFGVIL